MASYTKYLLSGSLYGKQILIASSTSASATFIHKATGLQNTMDEVWIYAYNDYTASLSCSILWGGTTEPNDIVRFSLDPRTGRTLVVDGKILQNALTIKAYAELANFISLDGFVNRIDNNTSPGSSTSSSYALSASYSSNGGGGGSGGAKAITMCAAFTPYLTGADAAEIIIPYNTDGVTPMSWSVNRLNMRVQLSGSTTSSVTIEKSTTSSVFSPTALATIVLNSQSYETFTGSLSASLISGDKIRFNVNTIGTAQYWTLTTEISSL